MFRASEDSTCKSSLESRRSGSSRWQRVKKRILGALAVAMLSAGSSGCMTMHNGWEALTNNGGWNDTVVVLRNRSFSAKAWHRRKHNFCRERYINDFSAGFRAGYEDVASGGGECTPAFPPQEYWGWDFQSAEGQARTSAWFAGYPHGARAADEDGLGAWQQLPMSSNYQAQYQKSGMFTHQGALYPIPDPDSQISGAVHGMPDGTVIMDNGIPLDSSNVAPATPVPMADPMMAPVPLAPSTTN